MKFLITAGPTREFIDPFRFISNPSSGKMGYALAAAARRRGQEVVLVSGPVDLTPPRGVRTIPVVSAREMEKAVLSRFPGTDVVIMSAAVSDYRPRRTSARKLKKGERTKTLPLVKNPDILKKLGRKKGRCLLVGFSAETENIIDNAKKKLRLKNLDFVVANDINPSVGGFGRDLIRVTVLSREGWSRPWPLLTKREVARRIIALVLAQKKEV
jgi:phosphopantothenoylcysteine decarboxylase/phosphopantothenate--cysteine ligase